MVEKFFLGVLTSLAYSELTGFVPGGIIVPAFVATTLDRPYRALFTLLAALLALALYRLASRYLLLFGRRRFVFLLLVGAGLSELSFYLTQAHIDQGGWPLFSAEMRIIGLVIPGLLASNLERQRFWPTLASFLTVTVWLYFLGKLISP